MANVTYTEFVDRIEKAIIADARRKAELIATPGSRSWARRIAGLSLEDKITGEPKHG